MEYSFEECYFRFNSEQLKAWGTVASLPSSRSWNVEPECEKNSALDNFLSRRRKKWKIKESSVSLGKSWTERPRRYLRKRSILVEGHFGWFLSAEIHQHLPQQHIYLLVDVVKAVWFKRLCQDLRLRRIGRRISGFATSNIAISWVRD